MKILINRSQVTNFFAMPLALFLVLLMISCGENKVSSVEEMRNFEQIGPKLRLGGDEGAPGTQFNAYRLSTGDVLEVQMPIVLKDVLKMDRISEAYMCRVNEQGKVPLPIIGEVDVKNKTLTEAEAAIINTYYPHFFKIPPAVVCKINEHLDERSYTVTGLVMKPGIYPYPTNVQYSIVDVIASSEGVDRVADPHFVKIFRRDIDGSIVTATYKIDKEHFMESANVPVKPGDVIAVQKTMRTQMNLMLSQMLRLNFGAYYRPDDL